MWTSLIAVVGTLAGAVVSGLPQHRVATRSERGARVERLRSERLEAVTALAVAVSDHRRAMWLVGEARLAGQPADRVTELREQSHRTRSAVTAPAVRVRLLVSDEGVRAAALEAVEATYVMRDAADRDDLQARRATALERHDAFVAAAGEFLAAA